MVSEKVRDLERENAALRRALEEINSKIGQNKVLKPKSCQYCKNYIQHYIRDKFGEYSPIYDGHCVCHVPISKGKKRKPAPDDTCPYFEIGTFEVRHII